MATSCTQRVRQGITTITNADTTMRTLCGRTTNLILPWRSAMTATKPVLALMVSTNNRIGGTGDRRSVLVLIAAFAEGTGAQTKVEDMIQRQREILTPAAFAALSPALEAVVTNYTDRDAGDETEVASPTLVARADLDLTLWVTAAQ